MNRSTTAFLFVLVLVLGGLVYWQTDREERGDFDHVEWLFAGVDISRVHEMHIDNIERGLQFTFERDARHLWALTDPIAYPARMSIIDPLLDIVKRNEAIRVPPDDIAFAEQGFDPPRMVFDVIESMPDDEKRTTRLELGAFDLDGSHLYVRVRGKLFRTLRNLDTTLQQNVHGFRDQRIFRMGVDDIVRVSRRGNFSSAAPAGTGLLQAHRQQFRWWIDQPVRGQADPSFFYLLLTNLASLRVDGFADDAPVALAVYGLQAPRLEVEIETRQGIVQTLLIGTVMAGTFAKRADLPYVWELRPADVSRLMIPADDLLDHAMVRVLRPEISRMEIENGVERIVLEREFDPRSEERGSRREGWTLWAEPFDAGPASKAPEGPLLHANRAKIDEILSELEHVEIIRYLDDDEVADPFVDTERLGVWLQLRDDRQGGRIGEVFVTEGGASARTYQRGGESEVSLVPAEIGALLSGATFLDLQSLALFETDEVYLRRLVVRHGDEERRFFRSTEGTWRYEDLDTVATPLFSILDALFFLRATQHLGPATEEVLVDPIEVEIMDYEGTWTKVAFGGSAEHGFLASMAGMRSILKDQELHKRLLALFEQG